MLKPDKWQATFDSDGKVCGFQKVLKLIILGVRSYFAIRMLFIYMQCFCACFDYNLAVCRLRLVHDYRVIYFKLISHEKFRKTKHPMIILWINLLVYLHTLKGPTCARSE